MGKSGGDEILGEINPGFSLWTSAHGFHHLSLTNRKGKLIINILLIHSAANLIEFLLGLK